MSTRLTKFSGYPQKLPRELEWHLLFLLLGAGPRKIVERICSKPGNQQTTEVCYELLLLPRLSQSVSNGLGLGFVDLATAALLPVETV